MKMGPSTELFDIPREYRAIFDGIHRFNRIQSIVFDDVFKTRKFSYLQNEKKGKKKFFHLTEMVRQTIF